MTLYSRSSVDLDIFPIDEVVVAASYLHDLCIMEVGPTPTGQDVPVFVVMAILEPEFDPAQGWKVRDHFAPRFE